MNSFHYQEPNKLLEYVNKRIEELTTVKLETFELLKEMDRPIDQLSEVERRELLENKIKFYSTSGALLELDQLKQILYSRLN